MSGQHKRVNVATCGVSAICLIEYWYGAKHGYEDAAERLAARLGDEE